MSITNAVQSNSTTPQQFPDENGFIGMRLNNRYTIIEKIGSGGQAKLFKAKDDNGKTVAVKIFDFQKMSDWKQTDLLIREVETLKNIHVPGIPEYIDFIEHGSLYFLVESFIPAKSLEHHLKMGVRFNEQQVNEILRASLIILNDLHHQTPPIIHRDIKPGNILWDMENHKAWIVDLGSIAAFRFMQKTTTVAGTAGYMAPEQILGMPTLASDIYGLGITAIHLLTGIPPWEMESDGLEIQYQQHLPLQLSLKFRYLLSKMLVADPEQRLNSAEKVLEILDSPYVPSEEDLLSKDTAGELHEIKNHKSTDWKKIRHYLLFSLKTTLLVSLIIGVIIGIVLINMNWDAISEFYHKQFLSGLVVFGFLGFPILLIVFVIVLVPSKRERRRNNY